MTEQQLRHAEESTSEAQQTVSQLEMQLASMTGQLHEARQEQHTLQAHFQVVACP